MGVSTSKPGILLHASTSASEMKAGIQPTMIPRRLIRRHAGSPPSAVWARPRVGR